MVTSKRDMMEQAARNFILRYHSSALLETSQYSKEAIECLQRSGFSPDFFHTFSIHNVTYIKQDRFPVRPEIDRAVDAFMDQKLGLDPEQVDKKRVSRLIRYHMTLSSRASREGNSRLEESTRNDSYIRVNEKFFGEISEIFEIPSEENFFIIAVQKFEKIDVLDKAGMNVVMPMNHFPFNKLNEFIVFHLKRNDFIQKGAYCSLEFLGLATSYDCLSFRPNEWFMF
jgi:hypothetical protein